MNEWKKCTLEDVSQIDTGFAFKSKEYREAGILRVIRGKNVSVGFLRWGTDTRFWDNPTDGLEKYFLAENDIVIGMDGSKIGENRSLVKKNDLPAILAQRVARIKAIPKISDQKYLWYVIFSFQFQEYIKAIHTGTSIPHISQSQIQSFDISLPSLQEQEAISAVLSSLDDKIDLLHRQNETLEALAQTLLTQWFMTDNGSSVRYFLEEIVFSASITYSFEKKSVVFLNTSDIYDGKVLHHNYSLSHTLPGQAKKSIKKGDILFSEIRPKNRRMAYIDFDAEDYVVSTKLMVLRSKDVISRSILFFYFKRKRTLDWLQMLAEARSGTFPQITFDHIKDLEIFIPKDEILLNNLSDALDSMLEKILQNTKQIYTLEKLRDTLLPKLMSGEVRVV